MASIFTRIINREIPGHIVAEDEDHIAFLDINPLVKGHTLVVPKQEIDYLFDLDDPAYNELQLFAKNVAAGLKRAIPCIRIGVAVIGLEVPHCHIHLIPMNSMDDINFSRPKLNPSAEELAVVADSIRQTLDLRSEI
jgi:histidine triad (HIT) family protein